MHLYIYGMCGLVSIFGLQLTAAFTIKPYEPLKPKSQFKIIDNRPEKNNNDFKKLTLRDIAAITTSDLVSLISVKPKTIRSTKHNGKRRDIVLKALRQILENKTRKMHQCHKNDKIGKVGDGDIESASSVVKVALTKPKSKMFKPEETNEIVDDSDLVRALANIKPKKSVNPNIENTVIHEIKNAITRLKTFDNPEKENTRTDKMETAKTKSKRLSIPEREITTTDEIDAKTRSKRHAKQKEKSSIDAINNGRDIVLEVIQKLIQNEKTRRHFDMMNPPNSKYSKRQQLLWDRLRVKAAAELLLHPKPLPEKTTERIFDTLKKDLELATRGPTLEPGLFSNLKIKLQKDFYMYMYQKELLKTREYISTLKPRIYES